VIEKIAGLVPVEVNSAMPFVFSATVCVPAVVMTGGPPKLTPHQRQEARARLEAGETQSDIARSYNVDATTIGRLA
jgi:hypothetical protein